MRRQSQTVFYIEQMQPTWISGAGMFEAYRWLAVRLPGVLIGLLVTLVVFTTFFFLNIPAIITGILLGGLLGGLLSEGSITQPPATIGVKVRSIPWQQFIRWLLVGVLIGLGVGLSFGLGIGLSFEPSVGQIFGPDVGLSAGLSFGLCSILLQVFLVKSHKAPSPSQALLPVWKMKWQRLIRSAALRNGVLAGLSFGLSSGLTAGLFSGLSFGLTAGLFSGLGFGLIAVFLSLLLLGKSMKIQLTDRLIWSRTSLGRSLQSPKHVRATLQIATLVMLIVVLDAGLTYGLDAGLIAGPIIGLISGLSYWLLIGLFQGVSSETIEDQQRMVPNQGIRRSAFNGLVLGCISALSVGLSNGPSIGLSVGLGIALSNKVILGLGDGLGVGLIVGLIVGLSAGLLAGLTTAALLFEEKGIESAYSQIFSATSDRIGNVLQLALNEQL